MAVWDTGLVVVGVVRSKGIEYHSSTLTNGELEFLRSRLHGIDTAQGDQLLFPPDAAHTRFFVRNDEGAAEFFWTETRHTSGPSPEFQRMWTELYDIMLGATPANLTPITIGTPEYEKFSESFPGYAATSINAGYRNR
ncbi:MAG: hypothetical protein H6812_03345 [Phycisphaeraceae bacterium]|nr:hypothetical protein [Phycisphaerales bacterium]MCB9842276.1 hypothetical protein [Phycisphaeraceae bacterium]